MTDRDKLQRIREAAEEARAFMATSYDHREITAPSMERIARALLDVVDAQDNLALALAKREMRRMRVATVLRTAPNADLAMVDAIIAAVLA